jgi:hypothetical protein
MVFDDGPIDWKDTDFPKFDWQGFYRDSQEPVPPNAPKPCGMLVQINAFVDTNHARNRVTHRSSRYSNLLE